MVTDRGWAADGAPVGWYGDTTLSPRSSWRLLLVGYRKRAVRLRRRLSRAPAALAVGALRRRRWKAAARLVRSAARRRGQAQWVWPLGAGDHSRLIRANDVVVGGQVDLAAVADVSTVVVDSTTPASTILTLAQLGAPLVIENGPLDAGTPFQIEQSLRRSDVAVGATQREFESVRLRRAAAMSIGRPSAIPSASVVLVTMRPDYVFGALAMIDAQVDVDIEVLVGLHGDEWDPGVATALQRASRLPLRATAFSKRTPFGSVLEEMSRQASTSVVLKWDDDDVYGPHHALDLLLDLRASGAQVVGKAAEFVWLESADVTIRRFAGGGHRYSRSLAGGALALPAEVLRTVGGWPGLHRHVDQGLLDRIEQFGGLAYRTHGFEYVLRRSDSGHTWSVSDEYFLRQATEQRSGLDLAFAGFPTLDTPT